ncbi:protein LIFEGUARD 2-like [Bidens hawaiensis]|uniref:protein LIFEGUARD 2-like n=1 Tax=Bidens hawaiensis TaxID=980011 RepID=UPI00404A315B
MSDQSLLKTDIESGSSDPPIPEYSPEHRWSFIRKVYSIVAMQLLFTAAVGAAVVSCQPLVTFMTTTTAGYACYALIILSPLITICPLYCYAERHPVNYVLLGIFTFGISFGVGMACAFTSARVVLEAIILTSAVVVSLLLFTFWAARKGYEFWVFFLCGVVTVLIVAPIIQIFFCLVKFNMMIYASLSAIIFCAYIVINIELVMVRYTYDEYIWAAVVLYLDIIRLFLLFLRALADRRR